MVQFWYGNGTLKFLFFGRIFVLLNIGFSTVMVQLYFSLDRLYFSFVRLNIGLSTVMGGLNICYGLVSVRLNISFSYGLGKVLDRF